MTKLTPYGKGLVFVGLLLIALTIALVHLFKPSEPEPVDTPYTNLTAEIEQLTIERDDWRKRSEIYRVKAWAYGDSIAAMADLAATYNQRLQNLKHQANEAKKLDYRRFTDSELERLFTKRYDTTVTAGIDTAAGALHPSRPH